MTNLYVWRLTAAAWRGLAIALVGGGASVADKDRDNHHRLVGEAP